jgi:hypothetical protein
MPHHPESLRDGKWSAEDRHHTHQTVPIPRTVAPNTIEAWALGWQEGRPSYREGGTRAE